VIIASPTEDLGRWVLLVILCIAAASTDLTVRKVPNALTFPAIVLGIVLIAAYRGTDGLVNGLATGAGCFAFMMLLRAIGGLGGGDVKLMAAIGCVGGWPFTVWALAFGMFIGGVMGLVVLVWRKNVFEALVREIRRLGRFAVGEPIDGHPIPYAVALAAGTLLALARESGMIPQNMGW